MRVMYSIHGTIDIIVDKKTEKQCDNQYYKTKEDLEKLVTQLDIDNVYKTFESSQ